MKKIRTGEMYAERCQQADNGNLMARLAVNAHRARVFAADLRVSLIDLDEEDGENDWSPVANAALFLVAYLTGSERYQAEMNGRAYDPVFPLHQCGHVANRLHELQEQVDESEMVNICEMWEKLSHVQFLLGTLYPNYIAVLNEARMLARGGLGEYAERMQAEAAAILDDEPLEAS